MTKPNSLFWIGSGLASVLLSMAGCASTYKQSDIQSPSVHLDSSMSVLISVPPDGWYEDIEYRNSGRMTVNAIAAAFSRHANKVDITSDCHGDECLSTSQKESYGYYVEPNILLWEERATEWSGRPDQIEIQLVVYDVATEEVLASSSYSGKSKWLTLGGDHPQDLLPEPTGQYVDSLYR
jgi:hypothetical protein